MRELQQTLGGVARFGRDWQDAPAASAPAMTYIVYSHDAWGTANVGEFSSLEQAREVFNALRSDGWYLADGTVKGLSIVHAGQTLETFSFQAS